MTTKKATTKKAQKFTETLVIDRKRWLTGESSDSYLYRSSDKKMCCLGFYARQHGCKIADIKDVGLPGEIRDASLYKLPKWMLRGRDHAGYGIDSVKTVNLAVTNDNDEISPKVREQRIKGQFAKVGVRVKFVN